MNKDLATTRISKLKNGNMLHPEFAVCFSHTALPQAGNIIYFIQSGHSSTPRGEANSFSH